MCDERRRRSKRKWVLLGCFCYCCSGPSGKDPRRVGKPPLLLADDVPLFTCSLSLFLSLSSSSFHPRDEVEGDKGIALEEEEEKEVRNRVGGKREKSPFLPLSHSGFS